MSERGRFVVFEGLDAVIPAGSGRSTRALCGDSLMPTFT